MSHFTTDYTNRIRFTVDWLGRVFAWLIVPLILAIVYDVMMRYVFSAPTIWSYDLSYMLGGVMMLIGLSYVQSKRAHIRVDVIVNKFSIRAQSLLNLVFQAIFFFPLVIVLVKISFDKALYAWQIHEISRLGMWHPSMIPFKTIMCLAFVLLLLEGAGQFLEDIGLLRREWRHD